MFKHLKSWFANQQRRSFHPIWIILVVAVTLAVGAILWIPPALISRVAAHSGSGTRQLPRSGPATVPTREVPMMLDPLSVDPTGTIKHGPKTIQVDFHLPDPGNRATGMFGLAPGPERAMPTTT